MLYQVTSLVGNHVCAHANVSQTNILNRKWSICALCVIFGEGIDPGEHGNNCKCYPSRECALIKKLLCRGIDSLMGIE